VNNPADDEAYEAGEATRVRRADADAGRPLPRRPGAPSAPPPPADSFRPAAPPPPADWFKPAAERHQGGAGNQPARQQPRDPGEVTGGGPGSAGYTSQPGTPAERYPTPRPGTLPSPVPATRRPAPRPEADPARPGGDRPTQAFGRADDGARAGGQPLGPGEGTEKLSYGDRGYGDRGQQGSDYYAPTRADGYGGSATGGDAQAGSGGTGGYQARRGGWDDWDGPDSSRQGPPSGPVALGGGGRPKRRRWPKITAIGLVVLLLLLVGVDRLAAHIAVGQMRKQVAVSVAQNLKPGQTPPTIRSVSIGGFPFLTQVIFGKYDDIGVGLDNIPTTPDGPRISSVDAHLKGVHVALSDAMANKIDKVPVDEVDATVRMTYADLNTFLKDQPFSFQLAPADGGKDVKITGSATPKELGISSLPGGLGTTLGQVFGSVNVQFGGIAAFSVENNVLTLTPKDLAVNAGGFDSGNISLGAASIPIAIPIPDNLPFSLKIVSAGTNSSGLSVSASAKNVVLPAKPPAQK
jgi:hypothetical protein